MDRGFPLEIQGAVVREASRYRKASKTWVWRARKAPLEF